MIAAFVADRRAGVSILIAAGLPLLLGFAAFAVDIGSIQLETRRLQGIADAAALAAASSPTSAQAAAQAVVAAAGWPRAVTVRATTGRYAGNLAVDPALRFTPATTGGDAARVTLETPSPTFFATIFGRRDVTIGRTATAARERMASFSIGSRLASLDGGVANALLSALTGSTVSLSVMDYDALANVDADLFGFFDALRTTAHVDVASYDSLLATKVTTTQALQALAATLDSDHRGSAAAVIRRLASGITGREIALSSLFDAGPLGGRGSGGQGLARIDSMAFVTALLQGASPTRQLSLDVGAGVSGVASTRLTLAIGERPNQSPWVAISDNGMPIIRTAQARIYAETQLAPTALPLVGDVGIKVPLFVELASAEARLKAIDCSTAATRSVTLEARPDPGTVALGMVNTAALSDFKTPIAISRATLLNVKLLLVPLIGITGQAKVDLGKDEPWRDVNFSSDDIAKSVVHKVSSGTITSSVASSLLRDLSLTPSLLGLDLVLDPLVKAVGGALQVAAPALDSVIGLATGALGVHIGEADLRVTGMRCGTPVLVA